MLFEIFCYLYTVMALLNIVRVPKLEVNVCKNAACKSKARAGPAVNAPFVKLLPHRTDARLFTHAYKWPSVLSSLLLWLLLRLFHGLFALSTCIFHVGFRRDYLWMYLTSLYFE